MVFFKNSKLYKVIQESKKVLGQVISINTKDLTAYSVNIQPIEEKAIKYTFGVDTTATKQAYADKDIFCIGDYVINKNKVYQIEKLVSWNTYDILALKEVDLEIEY